MPSILIRTLIQRKRDEDDAIPSILKSRMIPGPEEVELGSPKWKKGKKVRTTDQVA